MSVQYDFIPKPGTKKETEKPVLFPRVVSSGTIRSKELYKRVSAGTTFQKGELEGALNALIDELIFELNHGYTVELGKLGYFSLKLTSRPVESKKEIHAQSVSVSNINFRPSAELKRHFKTTSLERAKEGFKSSSQYTLEQRKARLENYLQTHPFIDRKTYSALTGLLKNKALADLKQFINEGFITTYGKHNHRVYLKK